MSCSTPASMSNRPPTCCASIAPPCISASERPALARELGEERHARGAQGAAHVDPGRDVGKFLDRAQIQPGIADESVTEQQPPALDVKIAAIGQVLAFLDLELAAAAIDAGVIRGHGDTAAQAPGQALRI